MGSQSQTELIDLLAVQEFYVSVLEKHLGHAIPIPAEIKAIKSTAADPAQAASALRLWLDLLDMAISPPWVRDALKNIPGLEKAHALLRYFVRKASQRSNDRDKTDCVITHLFRTPPANSPHQWTRPEIDSSYYFLSQAALAFEGEMYTALGDVHFDSMPPEQVNLLHEFEYFHQELEEFRHFDQVMDSSIVQRVRELKQSLGKSFYHPDSMANIAVWNDVFGRKFDDLFHDATKQIKTFAENVQREGGSIMSRVEGDITVKHLTEIETQQILIEDYQNAQDQFRKVSRYKKAVDGKRRVAYAPIPPRAVPEAPRPAAPAPVIPTAAALTLQPVSAATASAPASPAPPPPPAAKPTAAATPPAAAPEPLATQSQAVQNAVYEGKLSSIRDLIKNHVRSADPRFAHVVPVRGTKIVLSPAEVEAFRADYGGEKSFRADYVNVMVMLASHLSRMILEVDEYNQKASSAYLWKPHADALMYLLKTLDRVSAEAEQLRAVAQGRGLQDKVSAVEASLEKLKAYAKTVSQTLQSADQNQRK